MEGNWNIKKCIEEIDAKIDKNLKEVGKFLEQEIKSEISSMKAVDTGKYRDSITHTVDTSENEVIVSSDVEYSIFVELGTSKMPPRPAFRYALYKNEDKIKDIINK